MTAEDEVPKRSCFTANQSHGCIKLRVVALECENRTEWALCTDEPNEERFCKTLSSPDNENHRAGTKT
jgi:hypothetical protein